MTNENEGVIFIIMKKLSLPLLAETVESRRKAKKLTQAQLSKLTGINRSLLSRLESQDFTPSIEQLEALAEALEFDPVDLYIGQSHQFTLILSISSP